jgi:hypothetical protein
MVKLTNYEVEFDDTIEWNEKKVKECLTNNTTMFLPIYQYSKFRVLVILGMNDDINDILTVFYDLYFTDMRCKTTSETVWKRCVF